MTSRLAIGLMLLLSPGKLAAQQPSLPTRDLPRSPFIQQYYPVPSYVPSGFTLVAIYNDPPEGFHGGLTELRLVYRNLPHPRAAPHPLVILMTPNPRKRALGMTDSHDGVPVVLSMSTGDTVSAVYHDGIWVREPGGGSVVGDSIRRHWKKDTAHTLVFKWRGLTVAILGSRVTGVTYDELVRVAASLGGYLLAPR